MIGTMRGGPAAPSGIRMARAASGPYAEEASPSNPIAGSPAQTPILHGVSSRFESGRPTSQVSNRRRTADASPPLGMRLHGGAGWIKDYVSVPRHPRRA